MVRLSTLWLTLSAGIGLLANVGMAQELPRAERSADSETVFDMPVEVEDTGVENVEDDASKDVSIGVTPAGVQRQVAGRWATLAVNGANRSDQDTEETSVVMVGDGSGLQYARKVWIPAGARRQAWLPIRIPTDLYPDQLQVQLSSFHLKESEQGESFQANAVGMPISKRSLLLSWEESRTAVVMERTAKDRESIRRAEELTRIVYAGRDIAVRSAQDLGVVLLDNMFLPPTANPLDSLDQIVIASDRMLKDTVAVARLRAWLQSGGRVWIMVDQVEPDSVRALLGDAVCYGVVDRVELNDFEIERISQAFGADNPTETWSSETPVELVRVVVDTDDVQCRVDGWPAAFWVPVGQGEVLFTTLQAPGWLIEDEPSGALTSLSSRFFVTRIDSPKHAEELSRYLSKEIGYQIPSRGFVAALLGSHLLVILAAGLWLFRRKELQYMAVLVPLGAAVAAGILVGVGNLKTTAVPSTIATGQIVRGSSDSSEVRVESIAAIYSQESRPLPITSSPTAITSLSEDAVSGETKRIRWDDSGQSEWLFVEQPQSKVQHARSDAFVTLPTAWTVSGRFTPRGFEGRITGVDPAKCSDPVIVSSAAPNLAVSIDNALGTFQSGPEKVLLPNQFFDATLITDIQQDRQSLIRELQSNDMAFFPRQPSFLFWTEPIDAGVQFGDGFANRGWALVSIPIRIERLAPGSPFSVPSSFMRLESYLGARGLSAVFNPDTGRWLDSMNKPSESELRCVVPLALLPCQIDRCRVVMKVTAPGRTVTIKGMVDGQYQTLHEVESPSGTVEFVIDNPDALELDAEGGFLIAIAVSETEQDRLSRQQPDPSEDPAMARANVSRSTWAIEYVHLNVEGNTL